VWFDTREIAANRASAFNMLEGSAVISFDTLPFWQPFRRPLTRLQSRPQAVEKPRPRSVSSRAHKQMFVGLAGAPQIIHKEDNFRMADFTDEKAGLRRDAVRSQGLTRSRRNAKETGL
jgi:hypothetical protein